MGQATFKGRHNLVKAEVWGFLYLNPGWYRLTELSKALNWPSHALACSLLKWSRWEHRIERRKRDGFYQYRLGSRGRKWVEKWVNFTN